MAGRDRLGGHVHEHHLGGDAGPVGEMRKVHHPRQRGLGPVGSPALAAPVHRPHLEDVDRAVDEAGDRMGGLGGADGYPPSSNPVDPVLVIPDRRAADGPLEIDRRQPRVQLRSRRHT